MLTPKCSNSILNYQLTMQYINLQNVNSKIPNLCQLQQRPTHVQE